MSTGPTSLIGLLTSDVVDALEPEGYSAEAISSAVAMMMGICMAALGFLKLGFLLDFISYPVLTGFISAVAITIGLGQVDNLIGEDNVGDGAAHIIHDVFNNFGTCNGRAAGIGLSSVILLIGLQKAGEKWGKQNKVIWFVSITRAFIALLLFTGISYGVNKGRDSDDYLFDVVKVPSSSITTPTPVDAKLLGKVAGRSIPAFLGAAIEHLAIARAFGLRNNYVTDASQELCYLGVTNIWNSFYTCMGVGGAMSRTAVNSQCNVKSPLSGVVTTSVIVLALYKWTGALYWIPKATLAAIIITAIWPADRQTKHLLSFLEDITGGLHCRHGCILGLPVCRHIYRHWCRCRLQHCVRLASAGVQTCVEHLGGLTIGACGFDGCCARSAGAHSSRHPSVPLPRILLLPNVQRVKRVILDTIQTYHSPEYNLRNGEEAERNWSVEGERRIARLRKKAKNYGDNLPPIGVVVLDFAKVNYFDTSAVIGLKNFLAEVKQFAGDRVEVRLVALNSMTRERFERAGWHLLDGNTSSMDTSKPTNVRVFHSISDAVAASRPASEIMEVVVKSDSVDENSTVQYREKM